MASVDDHVSVDEPPGVMLVGFAEMETVGGEGGGSTVTVTLRYPAWILQPIVYVVVFGGATAIEPDVGPPGPSQNDVFFVHVGGILGSYGCELMHWVAPVDDHVSVVKSPYATVLGFAVSETVPTGTVTESGETVTVESKEAHDMLYVVVTLGETYAKPVVAPPVEKFVPVHELTR